jgi:cell division protein FtsL
VSRLGTIAFVLLLLATVTSAIGVVYARHESRRLFVQLEKLQGERDDLDFEFGRLQLEQATWAETNRIEQIARGQLGMLSPGPAETVITKR